MDHMPLLSQGSWTGRASHKHQDMHVRLVDAAVSQALHDKAHGIPEVVHAKFSKRALDNEQ